jgi:hypothetical protein
MPKGERSVTIPTMEDIVALQRQIDAHTDQIADLDARVTVLEGGEDLPPPNPAGGPGPACTGWLTAHFAEPHRYYERQEQQIVDALTYGTGTGGAGDERFEVFTRENYTTEMAKASVGFWSFVSNISKGNNFFHDDGSVDEAAFEKLLANWQKTDPRGVSRWLFDLDYPMRGVHDAASYGRAGANLARYLKEKGLPLAGISGPDEPDGRNRQELYNYVNALANAVHEVDPALVVTGPQTAWADSGFLRDMMNACPGVTWAAWNMYPSGDDIGEQAWKNPQYRDRAAGDIRNMRNGAPRRPDAYIIGGVNMDWNCTAQSQHNYCAAVYLALVLIDTLNGANAPVRMCIWDAARDGTCGFVPDPNNWATQGCEVLLTPFAAMWGRLAAKAVGKRVRVSGGVNGLRTLAIEREDGGCSLVILNADQGAQIGKDIALSHWPVNADGNGEVEVWQMGDDCEGVGSDGSVETREIRGGVLQFDLPDPSITVISSVA